MHDNTQSSKFEMILYKLFTMHHNCCNLVECHIILLTWYCTKLQLNDLQYLSTMHRMDACFAYESWPTNLGCVDCHLDCTTPENMPSPQPPYFAHYFKAKVGRENLLEYSIHLVHTSLPSFLTLEYAQGWQSRQLLQLSGKTSLNVHHGQSAALVLLQRQETLKQLALSVVTVDDAV